MKKNIIYIGLDVDDQNYHGTAFDKNTGEILQFKSRPTLKGLQNQLTKLKKAFPGALFKLCYEASYIGFTLQRDLTKIGYECAVVAPNSIPRTKGNQIKTDRVDSLKLAQFFANNVLTIVDSPDLETEQDRDLMRSRQYVLHKRSEIRSHIQMLLRRQGLNFKNENKGAHWTKHHICWLERTIESLSGSLKVNLSLLFQQMKWLDHTIQEYNKQIEQLATSEKYKRQTQALICYKGIKNIFAMTMVTEIGNIKRFDHPRKLVAWMGMDIREHSSGGKHHRFGITKHGNRYLRTAFIEANQRGFRTSRLSKDLKQRRKNIDPALVHIADRCINRLSKKGNRLLHAGKHPNKVKVAMAREMVGFVWESLNAVG